MSTNRRRLRRFRLRLPRRTKPGEMPGSVRVDPQAPQPVVHLLRYGPETISEAEVEQIGQLPEMLGDDAVAWINVDGLGEAETLKAIGKQFNLHPLALEDVVNVHQRPKVEEYTDHLFLVARMPVYNHGFENHGLETEQISFFLGRGFLLTFQERSGDCFNPVRERLRKCRGNIRARGADYLLYALLDSVVDSYFPVAEHIGSRLEQIEEWIVGGRKVRSGFLEKDEAVAEQAVGKQNASPSENEHSGFGTSAERNAALDVIGHIRAVRGELLLFRKTVWWTRDAMNVLIRDRNPLVSDDTRLYLRDCYDHTVQLIDLAETCRELTADLRDHYFSQLSTRTNDIMKVLTVIATIFIPLGFIAGLYGMNFDPDASPWNMPELNWRYGYPFALGVMLVMALGMLVYFWRRGWLRR